MKYKIDKNKVFEAETFERFNHEIAVDVVPEQVTPARAAQMIDGMTFGSFNYCTINRTFPGHTGKQKGVPGITAPEELYLRRIKDLAGIEYLIDAVKCIARGNVIH